MTRSTRTYPEVVIEPRRGWFDADLDSLWRYRELLFFLVWRDVKARYAQSVLGVGWAIIQPVVNMGVFTVIFGMLAEIDTAGIPYPLFSYTGLVAWTYFSGTLQDSTGSLVKNANMLQKVYFPRLLFPLTSIFSKLPDFLIASLLLIPLMYLYGVQPTVWAFIVPGLVVIMALTAAGLGTFLTALAIQYRDVQHGLGFGVQVFMYAAPVVYPVSYVPEAYRMLYAINPMVGVIEGLRASLLRSSPMPWDLIAVGAVSSVIIGVSGLLYFRRKESLFADVA